MIKKLRQKFVLVTMLFMSVTFGILFIVDDVHTKYWDEQDTLATLEWYAKSDSFFEFTFDSEKMSESYGKPIFAISLSKDLEILDIRSSSTVNRQTPSENDIRAIFQQQPGRHKWKSYLYLISEQEDGYILVITDKDEGGEGFYQRLGSIFLILAGFFSLLLISFILSRFVTEPAKRALEREKQFISDASHELKTPLAAISINAQALQTIVGDNRHLHHIISETDRMGSLIQKLLKLSYMEESSSKIEMRSFSLSKCCEEMALSMESTIYERRISFDYHIEENIQYTGNEDDIKQVIAILLDNAIKNTPELGDISFRLSGHNARADLVIENSGKGIDPYDLPHIFERFYRAEKSRSNESSSYGLGLAIAKAILDAHGAAICASSEVGKGASFTVHF